MVGAPDALTTVAGWLSTYWVHSAIACGLALAAGRLLLQRPSDRDVLWKLALVLPLLTSAPAAFGWRSPIGGPRLDAPRALRRIIPPRWAPIFVDADLRVIDGVQRSTTRVADPVANATAILVVAVAAALGIAAAAGVVRRRVDLVRVVKSRRQMPAHRASASIAGGRVRLSESAALSSPVALGRDEICVPPSFWTLSEPQQRSVLAHEMAHLERRDPLWIAIAEWTAALAAVQPLTRWVSAAFRRDAEFICDELAVRRTGDSSPLVESLAELARAFDPAAPSRRLAAGYDGSPLVERATRLLELDPSRAGERRGTLVWWCVGIAVVMLFAILPAVTMQATIPGRTPPGNRMVVDTSIVVER